VTAQVANASGLSIPTHTVMQTAIMGAAGKDMDQISLFNKTCQRQEVKAD
jgi:hypothetical protein